MKSVKLKFCSIIALAVAFTATLGTFFGLNFRRASADRQVTVSSTNIFSVSSLDDADVWSHKIAGEDASKDEYYTMFVVKNTDGAVNYRKNLAYKWFYNDAPKSEEPAEGEEEKKPTEFKKANGWFDMEIGFELNGEETLDFEKFIITFESQQYTQTEDNKTANYIVFVPTSDKKHVNVIITSEPEQEKWTVTDATALNPDRITIKFDGRENDKYSVTVKADTAEVKGTFENVGGNFARYSSSSTTPVTPLSFSAKYAEPEDEDADIEAASYARMVLYSLNGQSFKLAAAPGESNEGGAHYVSGSVTDDTAPVLCLEKGISFIEEGEEITFDYTVIDVLASSPSATTYYFMVTNAQADTSKDFNANDYSSDSPYRKVKSDEEQLMIPHVGHYVPEKDTNYNSAKFDEENFKVTAAVKAYLELQDTTSSGGVTTEILLDWYINEDYLVKINNNGTKNEYIAVATDKVGVAFAYTDSTKDWNAITSAYKAKVAENAVDLKAGSKNYFYLPSVEELLFDNVTEYSDLTFSIFYTTDGKSFQSSTGKSSSNLSINLTKRGDYKFTILATDAGGNGMYYYETDSEGNRVQENGKDKKVEIEASTSNIQKMYEDEDLNKYLPWFDFNVTSAELSIEDPKDQDTAYVGAEYDVKSFDINGSSYNTAYKLYRFKSEKFYEKYQYAMTYNEFMENKATLIKTDRDLFETITPLASMNSDDEEYEAFSPYAWDDSSLKFTPQDENAFYLITCTVTSTETGRTETAYMGISSSPQVNEIKGESTWLKDNLTSVILLSIAGVSLIGIILLLVIKPKNKGDLDEVYEKSAAKAKKSK